MAKGATKKKTSSDSSDSTNFNEYLERKKRLRLLHQRLKETKSNQEIYHKIMGSIVEDEASDSSETEEEDFN